MLGSDHLVLAIVVVSLLIFFHVGAWERTYGWVQAKDNKLNILKFLGLHGLPCIQHLSSFSLIRLCKACQMQFLPEFSFPCPISRMLGCQCLRCRKFHVICISPCPYLQQRGVTVQYNYAVAVLNTLMISWSTHDCFQFTPAISSVRLLACTWDSCGEAMVQGH